MDRTHANEDIITDKCTEYICKHRKQLSMYSKDKLFKKLCDVSDKEFLYIKVNPLSYFGEKEEKRYWEKGRDINEDWDYGEAYILYDTYPTGYDIEYEHFYFEEIFKPYWNQIYDMLIGNFYAGSLSEVEPLVFNNNDHGIEIDQNYKKMYLTKQALSYLGHLWYGAGWNIDWFDVKDRPHINIDKRMGIRFLCGAVEWDEKIREDVKEGRRESVWISKHAKDFEMKKII